MFKLSYHGVDRKRNGVLVILNEECATNVVEVKRSSDIVMSVKLDIEDDDDDDDDGDGDDD